MALTVHASNTTATWTQTGTTYKWSTAEASPVKIDAANLTTGVNFLLMYSVGYGLDSTSAAGEVYAVTTPGETNLAQSIGEGSVIANPYEPTGAQALHGFYVHTGDEVESIAFAYRSRSAGQTIHLHGGSLLAIDLSGVTLNSDYWFAQQNGATAEATWTSADTWVDVLSTSVTIPGDGDYLVLASMEGNCGTTSTNGTSMRLEIAGVAQKDDATREVEDSAEWHSFSYARVHNLTAGATTFTLRGGSMKGTSDKNFRRGRIFVFRAAASDNMQVSSDDASSTHTSQIPTFQSVLAKAYTPNQSEDVVVIGNALTSRATAGATAHQLYNSTDASVLAPYVSTLNQDAATSEQNPLTVFGTESITSNKTYQLRSAGTDGNSVYTAYGDLIVWSMELAGGVGGGTYNLSWEDPALTVTDETPTQDVVKAAYEDTALTFQTDEWALLVGAYGSWEDPALSFQDDLYQIDFVDGGGPTLVGRPRIVTATRIQQLRDLAGDDGVPSGGTGSGAGTAFWQTLKAYCVVGATKPNPEHYAICYAITADARYFTDGWSKLEAQIDAGLYSQFSADGHNLYYRDKMLDAAFMLDLCYDAFDQAQRDKIVNWMNYQTYIAWHEDSMAYGLWHHPPIAPATKYKTPSGWAINAPTQNYFSAHMLGLAFCYVATEGINPMTITDNWGEGDYGGFGGGIGTVYDLTGHLYRNGNDVTSGSYSTWLDFWNAKLNFAWVQFDKRAEGGGWQEGANYGRAALRHLAEAFLLIRDYDNGPDYIRDAAHPFLRDTAKMWLYYMQPGSGMNYSDGDGAGNPTIAVNPYDRHMMLMLVDGAAGTPESEYAQYWCENDVTSMSGISDMKSKDFWHYNPDLPATNYKVVLDTRYYAPGMDYWHSRSNWTDTAVAVNFRSTDCVRNHTHRGQNEIQVYRGGGSSSVDGWQLTDTQPFSNTLPKHSHSHNCISVNDMGLRFEPYPPYSTPKVGYNLTGRISAHEFGTGFSYGQGDTSWGYYINSDGTEPGSTSYGDNPMVDVSHRELMHILPGYVIVYDRVRLTSTTYNPVEAFWHYPYVQPTDLGGDSWRSTNDAGRVFQKILLPETYSVSWEDIDAIGKLADPDKRNEVFRQRIEVSTGTGLEHSFLSAFEFTSSATATATTVQRITTSTGAMAGCQIEDSTEHVIILFSAAADGAAPTATFTYTISDPGALTHRHLLVNMGAASTWGVTKVGNTITVNPAGTTHTASSAGVLDVSDFAASATYSLAWEDTALTMPGDELVQAVSRFNEDTALTMPGDEWDMLFDPAVGNDTFSLEWQDAALVFQGDAWAMDAPSIGRRQYTFTGAGITVNVELDTSINTTGSN